MKFLFTDEQVNDRIGNDRPRSSSSHWPIEGERIAFSSNIANFLQIAFCLCSRVSPPAEASVVNRPRRKNLWIGSSNLRKSARTTYWSKCDSLRSRWECMQKPEIYLNKCWYAIERINVVFKYMYFAEGQLFSPPLSFYHQALFSTSLALDWTQRMRKWADGSRELNALF